MGTERRYITRPCRCSPNGLRITETSPDHSFASSYEPTYTATLNCPECAKTYVPWPQYSEEEQELVLRSQVEAKEAAWQACRAFDEQVRQSQETGRLRRSINVLMAEAKSKTAQYRIMTALDLTRGEVRNTYTRKPYGVEEVFRHATANKIARTALKLEECPDKGYFEAVLAQGAALSKAHEACRITPLGSVGL